LNLIIIVEIRSTRSMPLWQTTIHKFHTDVLWLVLIKSWILMKSWFFISREFIPKHAMHAI